MSTTARTLDEKWNAYHDTVLEFVDELRPPLRVDLRRPDLDALGVRLQELGLAIPVAILTAENPCGRNAEDAPTDRAEQAREERNEALHARLTTELRRMGIAFARVDGVAPEGDYRERCVAIPLALDVARALAQRFDQLAFFWFDGRHLRLEPGVADHAPEVIASS